MNRIASLAPAPRAGGEPAVPAQAGRTWRLKAGIFPALSAMLLIGGCASFSPDGGFGPVAAGVKARTGQEAVWVRSEKEADSVRARVRELLSQPLTAQSAAQIALLNNPGLQASYAELGIAEADLVQASRWSGPKFSFARLRRGDETEYERSVFFDLLGLVTNQHSVLV